jgi:hypothetical protein
LAGKLFGLGASACLESYVMSRMLSEGPKVFAFDALACEALENFDLRVPTARWFHTRGLRKFGRPDLSVHRVPPQYREAVIDLLERSIEFQAFGGVNAGGQEVRMKTLPRGMTCHQAGDPDDPDFNNVHVEITPPGGEG